MSREKIPTVHELILQVQRMDKSLRDKDKTPERQAAVILLGAALGTFKQNVEDIIAKSGFNRDHVRAVVKNAKINGIWKKGKTFADWQDENGTIAFWCDVAVCMGWLQRK